MSSIVVGLVAGWLLAQVFDWLYYKRSKEFDRALESAQARIDALGIELAEARRNPAPFAGPGDADRPETPLLYLETHDEPAFAPEPDRSKLAEMEGLLASLRAESAEADRRARLFEARLTDVTSELASLRYGLPTLDRKAEDELREESAAS